MNQAVVDRLRLLHDWVIVRLDPESDIMSSGLYKPQGSNEHSFMTGTVYKTGPGEWGTKPDDDNRYRRKPVGVERGQKVLFIKFLSLVETTKAVRQIIGKEFGLMRPQDILLINAPGQREWFKVDKFNQ